MKLGKLRDKAEIRKLLNAAQTAMNVSSDVHLAIALHIPYTTLKSWHPRGSLPVEHRLTLMEAIRTGKAPTPDTSTKQRDLCKELFDEAWAALGPRGRAQLNSEFTLWIHERREALRRLDMRVAKRETG